MSRIDEGEHLLHLVADQVPAQLESRAINELAARQPGPAVARLDLPVDECRDEHRTAALGKPPRDLRFRARRAQPGELLGRLVGVGDDDGDEFALRRKLRGKSTSPSP